MGKSKLLQLLQSRKFWATVVGICATVGITFGSNLSQDEWVNAIMALVAAVAVIISSFNIGTAIEDAGAANKTAPSSFNGGTIERRGMPQKNRGRPSKWGASTNGGGDAQPPS